MSPGLPRITKATVLISGNGSNLQQLIDASSSTLSYLQIVRVISNRSSAYGLTRAANASIPTKYHNLISQKYISKSETSATVKAAAREKYDADLATIVLSDSPDIIICAGWMHIVTPKFLDPLKERGVPVINLHPALPGKYDGAGAIKRAWEDFQEGKLEDGKTGVMVHYVIDEVDRGQPILVKEIECRAGESLEDLEERIHEVEHKIIVEGTALAISKLWKERDEREKISS